MDSAVPESGANAAGAGDDEDEDDNEALKAHIAKMKAGGDASAGNGEQLARSVKCSEVSLVVHYLPLFSPARHSSARVSRAPLTSPIERIVETFLPHRISYFEPRMSADSVPVVRQDLQERRPGFVSRREVWAQQL